ncbi:MAG: hypothetical protein MR210_08190 [Erysipelotrichaceae bacterium]|nr:hypothetical protein [Erysipelotrichaceae bacterium]MDY5251179.1 hypothetical protein [Erysipelotrichaceae bacterium]
MSYIIILIFGVFIVYMLYNIFLLSKRNNKNRRLIALFDYFENEEVFFKTCDEFINSVQDAEFKVKGNVLKLWGACYYKHEEMIKPIIEQIDIEKLIYKKGKLDGLEINEDSIFYLCIACPNILYANKNEEDLRYLHDFVMKYADALQERFAFAIGNNAYLYYIGSEDKGKAFFEKVYAGEYGEYRYSKQLILLFKNVCLAHLARLYLDENNDKGYQELLSELQEFNKSKIGKRYLEELDIKLNKEESNA